MNYKQFLVFIFLFLYPATSAVVFAEKLLEKDILQVIDESVFEVVLLKPDGDSLTYEKPLPLHLIPYTIRTDKYYPIGTAFAVSDNTFLSCAHVFNLEKKSQFRDVYLRSKKGEVFEVDKILKYASHKDFVLFTIKSNIVDRTLEMNEKPVLNETVFAAGNALGQGIILRHGILTSKTLEEENGEWEWLRFSAPVSPGNSGSPLLDKNGRVIGMITKKSENENLNYALPISVINNLKENIAVSHIQMKYFLPNTDKSKLAVYDYQTSLPKSYHDLKIELTANLETFIKELLNSLLEENKDTLFSQGRGSLNLLHSTYSAYFPHLICQEQDGNWDAFHPSEVESAELGNNGFLEYGKMYGITFIQLVKPDNLSLKELNENTKLAMDLILKGMPLYRQVMNDSYFSEWNNIIKQEYPYNKNTYSYESNSYINTLHSKYSGKKESRLSEMSYTYTVEVCREGSVDDESMKAKINQLISNISIHE